MQFLRNREIKLFAAVLLIISALGTTLCFFMSVPAGVAAGTTALLLIAALLVFTRWRYAQISRLNTYLKRINSGDYALDVRDNTEGELSILRNELYKVTVMLRQQNETLSREKTKLAQALSDISHQLKTPLTSMFMMTDLLCSENLPGEKRTVFTKRMRVQLERIQWLVSSLLKLSRLDAKAIMFHRRPVPIRHLVEKACAPLLIPIELKSQTLSITGSQADVYCDENWTAEALINILKNCVEHTPKHGEITISCEANPLYTQILIPRQRAGD